MSNRERIISLLDHVPDYKLGYILAYVQGITAEEYPSETLDAMRETLNIEAGKIPAKRYRTVDEG